MTKGEQIEKLRALQVERNRYGSFDSYEQLLDWADSIGPLVAFDSKLSSEFKETYDLLASDEELDRSLRYPAINRLIGVARRALVALEASPCPVPDPPTQKTDKEEGPFKRNAKAITLGVAIVVIGTFAVFVIKHFTGLDL